MNIGLYHAHAGTKNAGGKAVFVREMAKALAADHDVVLYTQFADRDALVDSLPQSSVTLYRIPPVRSQLAHRFVESWTPFHTTDVLALASGVRSGLRSHVNSSVDVLLTHRYLDDLCLSRLVDVPTVYQYHNVTSPGVGAWAREYASGTDAHLANSEQIAREVQAKLDRSVDGVVTPGLDPETFTPAASPHHETAVPEILFVGRVQPEKGIYDLLSAIARLSREVRLSVVGAGETDAVRRRADRLGLEAQVTVLGALPHEALPRQYAACDVFCNPTRYEGFGMVNVEAMACGCPVITSDLPAVREYASHETNALLVSPGDVEALTASLDRLLDSPSLRDSLSDAGRQTARQFSWATQADRLAEFCRQVTDAETEPSVERYSGPIVD